MGKYLVIDYKNGSNPEWDWFSFTPESVFCVTYAQDDTKIIISCSQQIYHHYLDMTSVDAAQQLLEELMLLPGAFVYETSRS